MKGKGAQMILHQIEKDKRVVQNDTKAPVFPAISRHSSSVPPPGLLTGEEE